VTDTHEALVKSQKCAIILTPEKIGIKRFEYVNLMPGFTGMTTCDESSNNESKKNGRAACFAKAAPPPGHTERA
jgi:hypothetical protein